MIVILGGSGLIGTELRRLLHGYPVLAPTRQECDLSNLEALEFYLRSVNPEVVINAAAYTNVDQAEQHLHQAFLLNAALAERVAKVCSELQACKLVVHISTDYIFGGKEHHIPYREDDQAGPIQVYGLTKLLGEELFLRHCLKPFLLVRTSWVYGRARASFPEAIVRNLKNSNSIPVVSDQFGFPTHAQDVAGFIVQALSDARLRGLIHVSGSATTVPSRCDQAQVIASYLSAVVNIDLKVKPFLSSDEHRARALRPTFSALDTTKAQALAPQHIVDWKIRLVEHLEELQEKGRLWKS
jgi:dTDP-4-dehydrorhamnose reductase